MMHPEAKVGIELVKNKKAELIKWVWQPFCFLVWTAASFAETNSGLSYIVCDL